MTGVETKFVQHLLDWYWLIAYFCMYEYKKKKHTTHLPYSIRL